MKRYRIVKNDEGVYRVQRRIFLGITKFWVFEKSYDIQDTYPKVVSHPVEFKTLKEAEDFIAKRMKSIVEHQKWQVVKAFSDSKPVT